MWSSSTRRIRSGRGYSSWEGIATDDRLFTVMFAWKERMQVLISEVTVSPRKWSLPERSATEEYKPMGDSVWGRYESGELTDSLQKTAQGSGPWEGRYYLDKEPVFTGKAWLAVNSKFVDTVEYALAKPMCGLAKGSSVSVHDLNVHCKTSKFMEAFRKVVFAHERKHGTSLNKCIRAANDDGRLAAVEAIVKTSESDVETEALKLWTNKLRDAILDARETDQSAETSKNAFWWRYDVWRHGLHRIGGHSGTDGCPQ